MDTGRCSVNNKLPVLFYHVYAKLFTLCTKKIFHPFIFDRMGIVELYTHAI